MHTQCNNCVSQCTQHLQYYKHVRMPSSFLFLSSRVPHKHQFAVCHCFNFPFLEIHVNWVRQYVLFYVCHLGQHTRVTTLTTFIWLSIWSMGHSNYATKINKEHPTIKVESNCHCLQITWSHMQKHHKTPPKNY
jgi:hypothetical protein